MANNTVCRGRQTAFLPRLKPGVSCLFLMKNRFANEIIVVIVILAVTVVTVLFV